MARRRWDRVCLLAVAARRGLMPSAASMPVGIANAARPRRHCLSRNGRRTAAKRIASLQWACGCAGERSKTCGSWPLQRYVPRGRASHRPDDRRHVACLDAARLARRQVQEVACRSHPMCCQDGAVRNWLREYSLPPRIRHSGQPSYARHASDAARASGVLFGFLSKTVKEPRGMGFMQPWLRTPAEGLPGKSVMVGSAR